MPDERPVPSERSESRDLCDAVAAWTRALEAEDAAALGALLAPDAVFLAPGQAPVVGRDMWLKTRSRRPVGVHLRTTVEQVSDYGDAGHAWSEVQLVIPAEEGSGEVRVEGHTLALYRREQGKWLRAKEATMLAPAR